VPKTAEPVAIERLTRLNESGPDDLFICCASFEDRCLSSISKMKVDFRTRFAVIFVIEEPLYKKQVDDHKFRLQAELARRSTEGAFIISCRRDDPADGLNQFKQTWKKCQPGCSAESFITIDISGFTKIYLLELLHYLVTELELPLPRVIHTTQVYLPTRLTDGIAQISTIPSFYGQLSLDKETVLVLFLGFEPERSLAVWKHANPARTIALITSPPRGGNLNYLKYARENNSYLLSQPSVEVRDVPPDSPYGARQVLETIFNETKGSLNMVIGPFGTKPQVVGMFLFCAEHPRVQVIYSFPVKYTRSYLRRKPGSTLLLPLATPLAV